MNQLVSFQSSTLEFAAQVLVKNKMHSPFVFHLSVQIFNTNLSPRDPVDLKTVAIDQRQC